MFPTELTDKLTRAREAKVKAVRAQGAVAEAIQADQVANDARHEVLQAVAEWLDAPVDEESKPARAKGRGKKADVDAAKDATSEPSVETPADEPAGESDSEE